MQDDFPRLAVRCRAPFGERRRLHVHWQCSWQLCLIRHGLIILPQYCPVCVYTCSQLYALHIAAVANLTLACKSRTGNGPSGHVPSAYHCSEASLYIRVTVTLSCI